MSEKNLLISFDQLSTEILFDIFDYLSCNDIIYTFFHLNQRFNSILLQNGRLLNNFTTPINNFCFWQIILPIISSYIDCLIITTIDFSFSLDIFPNLKSLIISSPLPINYDKLTMMLKSEQFEKLNSFKIKSEIVDTYVCYESFVFDNILNDENSLYIFESLPGLYWPSFNKMKNLEINVNLQSLSLKLLDIKCLYSLLNHIPNLKYLNVQLKAIILLNRPTPNIDLSPIKLKKISITVQNGGINHKSLSFLTEFLQQFSSSLIYLSLLNLNQNLVDKYEFNGSILQKPLLELMIQLKSFHLYIQLDQISTNIESFLSTFQSQFYLDHYWTFGLYKTYLFTLPFHFDKLNDYIDFDEIKSNNLAILNSPKMWSTVKSIDPYKSSKINLNLMKQMKLKMLNLTSITFTFEQMKNLFTNNDQIDIKLDSITTVRCENEDLQNIKRWLIKIFPNTRHIELSYSVYSALSLDKAVLLQKLGDEYSRETDSIYYSKVQYVKIKLTFDNLDICEDVIYLVKGLLELFKNLPYFGFLFYQMSAFPHIDPFTDLSKMIELLNMKKISEEYHIKDNHNCLQFIRKNND